MPHTHRRCRSNPALFIGDNGGFDAGDTSGSAITFTGVDEALTLGGTPVSDPGAEHSAVGRLVGTLARVSQDRDDVSYSLSGTHAAMMDAINRWSKVKVGYYCDQNPEDRDSVLSEEFITIK